MLIIRRSAPIIASAGIASGRQRRSRQAVLRRPPPGGRYRAVRGVSRRYSANILLIFNSHYLLKTTDPLHYLSICRQIYESLTFYHKFIKFTPL